MYFPWIWHVFNGDNWRVIWIDLAKILTLASSRRLFKRDLSKSKLGMTVDVCMAYMVMLVWMTLIVMQGHSGSAKATIQCWIISTTKPATRIKLATTVSDLFFYGTLTLQTFIWLDHLGLCSSTLYVYILIGMRIEWSIYLLILLVLGSFVTNVRFMLGLTMWFDACCSSRTILHQCFVARRSPRRMCSLDSQPQC